MVALNRIVRETAIRKFDKLFPGDVLIGFDFQVKAMYPVKAKGVSSQAYSYYQPEFKGETLGSNITVR